MTGYEIYIFVLCLVVFVALTAFFATLITCIVKMNIKLIRGGVADKDIIKQRERELKRTAVFRVVEIALTVLFLTVSIMLFAFSLSVKVNEKQPVSRSVVKVVKSASMSIKDEYNKYLAENGLNDQIQMFDLIKIAPLPEENKLKLYDIVVYEVDGQMVVHRIVDINEPDASNPVRRFLLRGDANRYSDKFPVLYSQMKGIYTGEKISYIGSFVIFMNSPAGYLCVILVITACLAYPFIEKKLKKESELRLAVINGNALTEQEAQTLTEPVADKMEVYTGGACTAAGGASDSVVDIKEGVAMPPEFRGETLRDKYLKLTEEQKRFYDEIVAHAASVGGNKRIVNTRYEEYKAGNNRLVRVLIKRGTVLCEYTMPDRNLKNYIRGSRVKVKYAPITLKVTDETALRAAKDSVDIAKKNIEDEKAYKKERAKQRRRERRVKA